MQLLVQQDTCQKTPQALPENLQSRYQVSLVALPCTAGCMESFCFHSSRCTCCVFPNMLLITSVLIINYCFEFSSNGRTEQRYRAIQLADCPGPNYSVFCVSSVRVPLSQRDMAADVACSFTLAYQLFSHWIQEHLSAVQCLQLTVSNRNLVQHHFPTAFQKAF